MTTVKVLLGIMVLNVQWAHAQTLHFDITDIPTKDSITHAFTLNNAYDAMNSWSLYRNTKVKIQTRCVDSTFQQCKAERYYFFNKDGTLQKDSSAQGDRKTIVHIQGPMRMIETINRGRSTRTDTVILNSRGKVIYYNGRRNSVTYTYDADGLLKKETRKSEGIVDEINYKYFKDSINFVVTSYKDGQSHSQTKRYVFDKYGQQLLDSLDASEYRRYFYENKRLVKVQTEHGHWQIKYGPGQRKEITIYGDNNEVSENIIHEFRDRRTESITTTNIHGDLVREVLKYDRQGKITELRTIGIQGQKLWKSVDTRGRVLKEYTVTKNNSSFLLYEYVDY